MNCTINTSCVRLVGVSKICLISALVNGSGASGSGRRTNKPSVGSCATFLQVRYNLNTCRPLQIMSRMVLFLRLSKACPAPAPASPGDRSGQPEPCPSAVEHALRPCWHNLEKRLPQRYCFESLLHRQIRYTQTPDFERSQGFCGFWCLDFFNHGCRWLRRISKGASENDVGKVLGVWEVKLES